MKIVLILLDSFDGWGCLVHSVTIPAEHFLFAIDVKGTGMTACIGRQKGEGTCL